MVEDINQGVYPDGGIHHYNDTAGDENQSFDVSDVAKQRDEYERRLREEAELAQEKQQKYNEFLLNELEDAPVISVVSDEAFQKIKENPVKKDSKFAINVARITEKKIQQVDILDEEMIVKLITETINDLCNIGELDQEHTTWKTVKILHDTWSYGECIRRWWNKQYLRGEELENFEGVFDYRDGYREEQMNMSYRVKPAFPGRKL
ncbi:MAG: hypothetical protein ACOX6Q_03600 [Candidatus Dojkabacteria bacterium]|jgi:hypothetical protein